MEAARKILFEEIAGVFGAYGIGVDSRHVSLISDSMMYSGDHRCFPTHCVTLYFPAAFACGLWPSIG